ncbi:hypothetical protein [uncultured Shimia sp.]|uniref:hypothetical protein n=1 Tax=uncultured Shimia sp. TaxID=573152 RepID=UPI0026051C4F|nr:hypothetical protein [uncultured Shimia sp.]
MGWFSGLVGGLLIGSFAATAFVVHRVQSLTEIEFETVPPPVPFEVLEKVRGAEMAYYSNQSSARRFVELMQDVMAFLHPPLVYQMNFSVGPFRLKGKTLEQTIPWALDEGYLIIAEAPVSNFHWLYVYLAEQPGLSTWGAAVHLEFLRKKHPLLREISWTEIASDPALVAKIYSGYLGAGDDWATWEENLTPGSVATSRLNAASEASQ